MEWWHIYLFLVSAIGDVAVRSYNFMVRAEELGREAYLGLLEVECVGITAASLPYQGYLVGCQLRAGINLGSSYID